MHVIQSPRKKTADCVSTTLPPGPSLKLLNLNNLDGKLNFKTTDSQKYKNIFLIKINFKKLAKITPEVLFCPHNSSLYSCILASRC